MNRYLTMNPLDFPILSMVIFLPLAGVALILAMKKEGAIKVTALIASIVTLGLSIVLCGYFDPKTTLFQFGESRPWIPMYGITYTLGIDGLTVLLIVLTAVIAPICILCSWERVPE